MIEKYSATCKRFVKIKIPNKMMSKLQLDFGLIYLDVVCFLFHPHPPEHTT